MKAKIIGGIVFLILLFVFGCASEPGVQRPDDRALDNVIGPVPAHIPVPDPHLARDWFDLQVRLIRAERFSPPVAARAIGYAGVGFYEAIVPGFPRYQTLAGQLNGLAPLPAPDPALSHSWPLVGNRAIAQVLRHLFASGSPAHQAWIDSLETAELARYGTGIGADVVASSVTQGDLVSAAVIAWADTDGMLTYGNCPYMGPEGPGYWVPTPPAYAPPLLPCWGELRTFACGSGSDCPVTPPPAYSEQTSSRFYEECLEVYAMSRNLTSAQRAIADYWSDDPGPAGTPPGHWVAIAGQVVTAKRLPLDRAAEMYARLGIAAADAFICCWNCKYEHCRIRPVTAIRRMISPNWMPILVTPPFPEYTSGHSVVSSAVANVLTHAVGSCAFRDSAHVNMGIAPKYFPSFLAAAEEAAYSRMLGGIHFRSAVEIGLDQGTCIAEKVNSLRFRRAS